MWALFAIGEQMIEIYCVLLSRFHYSMDVVMALVVTFLLYTNGAVAVFAKQWELRGWRLLVPQFLTTLFPSCQIFQSAHYPKVIHEDGVSTKEPSHDEWLSTEMWSTRGDIYVPFCCFPFCCLAGRQHIYSDNDMRSIGYMLSTIVDNPCKMDFEEMQGEWNLGEGVSGEDLSDMIKALGKKCGCGSHQKDDKPSDGVPPKYNTSSAYARELSGLQEPLVGSEAVAEAV